MKTNDLRQPTHDPAHSATTALSHAQTMKATSSSVERRFTMRSRLRFASRWAITTSLAFTLGLLCLTFAWADITNGLVAYYPFNGNANDASGNGYNPSITNSGVLTSNRLNEPDSAYECGPGKYMVVPHNPTLDSFDNQITIAAWVQRHSTNSYNVIVAKDGSSSHFIFWFSEDGRPHFAFQPDNWGGGCACDRAILDTLWHHLAVTYDGSRVVFYVDGVEAGINPLKSHMVSQGQDLEIGVSTHIHNTLQGVLDEVRLYNRALTAEDIQELFIFGNIPEILHDLRDEVVLVSSSAMLQIVTAAAPELTYRWWHGVEAIAWGTNATLWITNAQQLDAGQYSVVITNNYGSITSRTATLSVLKPEDDPDHDGVINQYEVQYGTKYNDADSDGDVLTDYEEIFVYHSDPNNPDSNGDGVNDGDAVRAGRSPTATGTQYYYDRTDHLVGAEYANGFGIVYQYDGNGNLVRQAYVKQGTNGLSSVWAQVHGLTNTGPSGDLFGDADGDGWNNYQEWKGDTSPTNSSSFPNMLGLAGDVLGTFQLPFTPSNFVVDVGQLDGVGAEEIVIGADGNPGTSTNFLLLLTQTSSGWTTNRIDVGPCGVTSVGIGQVTNRPSPAIYLGFRNSGSTGGVMEARANGANGWLTNIVAWSTNEVAQVLGVDSSGALIAELAATNPPPSALVALTYDGTSWSAQVKSTQSAGRSLGLLTGHPGDASREPIRLLESGGIELGGPSAPKGGLIGYWSFDNGDGTDSSGNGLNGEFLGVPTATRGVQSGALAFDGLDDYIKVPYNAFLDTPHLTISLWLKADAWNPDYHLFGRNRPDTSDIYRLGGDSASISFYLSTGFPQPQQVSVPAPSTGAWHHVATTWDGTTMQMFIDGSPRGSRSAAGTIPADPRYDQTALFIAKRADYSTYFRGALDEIRFYNRALSAAEVGVLSRIRDSLLAEPSATRTNNWRGNAFGWGSVRGSGLDSLFYGFVDDKDNSGLVGDGDNFVVTEYCLNGSVVTATNVARLLIANSPVAQSYGLASVNYLNSTNEVLFTGEPDGRVFAWTATNATGPLQRQLFSANHAGKQWHAMASVRTPDPGEGLVGLLVDPAHSNTCNVVFWPPQRELWQPAAVPQTAPVANLLPVPNSSQALATNMVQLWDAEGSPSIVELQYSGDGASWTNMPIWSVDNRPSGYVSAMPTGSTHTVVWKADSLFGVDVFTNIQVRVRARDVSGPGNWSSPLSYSVSISAGNPIAVDDTVTVSEGVITNINVLSNDQVTNGRPKHLVGIVSPPSHGTATTNADSTIRYQSAAYYSGPDALVYEMGDDLSGTSVAMVRITVTAINHPPEARSFSYQVDEHQPLVIQWNTDRDADGDLVNLESVVAASTAGGTVTLSGGRVTYTPPGHFAGIDTFTYTIVDNGSPPARASGTVTVTVVAVNDAPSLVLPDAGTTTEDLPLVFGMNGTNLIQVSDVDAGTQPLRVSLSCTNGTLTLSSTNGLSFTSGTNGASSMVFAGAQAALNAGLINLQYRWRSQTGGVDALSVTVNDQGNTGQGGSLSTNGVIPLTITGVNDPPVVTLTQPANGAVFYAATNIALVATASDVDGVIVKVDFLSDTTILATVTNAPYQFVWTNVATGIYRLSARATDNYDLTGTSAVAQIANSPTGFVLVSPVAGPTGLFSMSITGVIGQTYVIQKSSDLADTNGWIDVGRRTNVSGTVDYSELLTSNAPATYFRAKLGP